MLHDDAAPFDARTILETAAREQVQMMSIVGDAYARPLVDELRHRRYDLSSLTTLATGGAMTSPALKHALLELLPHLTIVDGYGASETGGMAFGASRKDAETQRFRGSTGAAVLSEDRSHFLEPGTDEIGWMARLGRIPLGYLNDPEATERTFPVVDGRRLAVPGDRGTVSADGTIVLLGRDSMVINSGGEKIFVEEVEEAIRRHPDVVDAVVVGRPSERFGEEGGRDRAAPTGLGAGAGGRRAFAAGDQPVQGTEGSALLRARRAPPVGQGRLPLGREVALDAVAVADLSKAWLPAFRLVHLDVSLSERGRVTETSSDGVAITAENGVLEILLDRPTRKNALDEAAIVRIVDTLERAAVDDSLRAIVVRGAGQDFCTGADWVARNRDDGARPRTGSIQRRTPLQAHRLIELLLEVQLPVVCAVRGWAAGLGCQIALAADFTVAAESARFWEPFVRRGFSPDSGATWLLPRLVGVARAKELLLLGRELPASEAAAWGLIHRAVPDDELDNAVNELIGELANGDGAVGLTKRCIHRALDSSLADAMEAEANALELSSRSADFKEGLAAFREKRPAEFEGR